jgi:Fe-S-cluster-containing dehydrogenase component
MDRRNFLKTAGVACATVAGARSAKAQEHDTDPEEFVGVLVDTTRCIGCRSCEVGCALAHSLPVPDVASDGALEAERTTSETAWTVVNRFETDAGEVFVKKQCMHCWQPACAAACLTNAMKKTESGPVTWDGDKCMGCRFCMVSCPFDIPKFEYDHWNPRIQKCNMCFERLEEGLKPACVESCPTDALMFGTKRELMEIARTRIYKHPDRYVHQIYGEFEAGGTGWLYLAAAPFEQLGFRTDLGVTPYPEYTRDFLYAVPVVFFGMPALLYGLSLLGARTEAVRGAVDRPETGHVIDNHSTTE